MENFHFGKNLREIRETKTKFSQEDMGHEMGISQATYSRIERRKYLPERELIVSAAMILKVPVSDLTPSWYDPKNQIDPRRRVYRLTTVGHGLYGVYLFFSAVELSMGLVESPYRFLWYVIIFLSAAALYLVSVKRVEI